jgi:hypothetical protein
VYWIEEGSVSVVHKEHVNSIGEIWKVKKLMKERLLLEVRKQFLGVNVAIVSPWG